MLRRVRSFLYSLNMFEMLAQMAIVCYVSEQRKAMTSLHFCTGSPEPKSLDKALNTTQTVRWVSFMLAAQALASLNIAQAHRSRRHSTKANPLMSLHKKPRVR